MLDKLLAQLKEFKSLKDEQTIEQILRIVSARIKNISNHQLQAIPQTTLTQFLTYLRDSNPDEELLDWAVYALEKYKSKNHELIQLEKELVTKLSAARRETRAVTSSDHYSRVGDAETLKCKDGVLLICNYGTAYNQDSDLPPDRAIQLEIAVQGFCKKQGRYWRLRQIHSDINTSTKTNSAAFEREYAQLTERAKECFSFGLYSLGREYFAFKGEAPRADLVTSNYPLDKLLEPLVVYNAEELSLRTNKKLPTPLWQTHRTQLGLLHSRVRRNLEEIKGVYDSTRAHTIREQQNDVLQKFRDINNSIFGLIEFILGRPPCKIGIHVHGSISRSDPNTNSDLEFTPIVENPNDENALAYLHSFLQLWDFLITILGKWLDMGSVRINYNEKTKTFSTIHVQRPLEYAKDVVDNLGVDSETDNTKLRPVLWYGSKDLHQQSLHHIATLLTPEGQKTVLLKIARIIDDRQLLNTLDGKSLEKKKETLQLLVWAITHLAIYRGLPQNHSNHPFDILDWLEKQNILDEAFVSLCREKLCWLYEKRFTDLPIMTPGAIALQASEIRSIDVEILKPFARFLVLLAENHPDTQEKKLDIRRFRDANINRPIITDYQYFPPNLKSIVDRIRNGDESGLNDFAVLQSDAEKEKVLNTIDWSSMKTSPKKLYDKIKKIHFGHLNLHGFPLPMKKLEKLLKNSPNLQSFLLNNSKLAKENLWEMLAKHCKSLKGLYLSQLPNLTLPIKIKPYQLLAQLTEFTIDGCYKIIGDENGSFLKSSAILLYEADDEVNKNPTYALHYYRRALMRAHPANPSYEDSFDDFFKALTLDPMIEDDPYFSEYSAAIRACVRKASHPYQKTNTNQGDTSHDPEFHRAIINGQLDTAVQILRTRFYQNIESAYDNDDNDNDDLKSIINRFVNSGFNCYESTYTYFHSGEIIKEPVWCIQKGQVKLMYNPVTLIVRFGDIFACSGLEPKPGSAEKMREQNALHYFILTKNNIKRIRTIDIPTKDGLTPLHCLLDFISCDNEFDANTVQFLIDNGTDIEAHDNKGFTPLQKAKAKGLIQIAIILAKMALIESSVTNPARNITADCELLINDPTSPHGQRYAHVVPSRAAQSSATSYKHTITHPELGILEYTFVMPSRRVVSINLRTLAEANYNRETEQYSSGSMAAAAAAITPTPTCSSPAMAAAACATPTSSSTAPKPTVDDVNYKNGMLNAAAGKHTEAISDFDKVIQSTPRCMLAYLNRAISKATMGRKDDAIRDYIAAVRLGYDKDFIVKCIGIMTLTEAKAKIKPSPQAPRSTSSPQEFFKPAATFKSAAVKPADSVRGNFLSRSSSGSSASPANRSSGPRTT